MNISILLLITIPLFYLAYKLYGSYIFKTVGENDARPTPAVAMKDGVDYVPSQLSVVFAHHFASIAGSGPILGPTLALAFGFAPAWLWVVLGGVFFGAVHDYTSLFVSLREKGHSMAQVSNNTLGRFGFILFILFTLFVIFLVTGAFLGLTATALSSLIPLKAMGATSAGFLKTVVKDGVEYGKIGGIASTSVIVITSLAPFIGYMLYKKEVSTKIMAPVALAVCALSIVVGVYYPIAINPKTWMYIISVYVLVASAAPVWMILQPRDYTNTFILYIGIAALIIGVVGGGLAGVATNAPAFNIAQGTAKVGMLWPFLFITIACGAISGFHSLVSAGTSSKQLSKESHARNVGYAGMLLESLLAVLVILAVSGGLNFNLYLDIVYPAKGASNPILAFALGMGGLLNKALGLPVTIGAVFGILMVEGFVVTTLDSAVRLNRYLLEELWAIVIPKTPAILKNPVVNSVVAVGVMLYLGQSNTLKMIWPIFGSANQLLAALTLVAVSVWLAARNKPNWFTVVPAVFMMATTLMALYQLLVNKYLPANNVVLIVADVALMGLAAATIILAAYKLYGYWTNPALRAAAQPGDD